MGQKQRPGTLILGSHRRRYAERAAVKEHSFGRYMITKQQYPTPLVDTQGAWTELAMHVCAGPAVPSLMFLHHVHTQIGGSPVVAKNSV